MAFTHYDLGQLKAGQIVEVTLSGSAANVRLMDSSNLSNYKNGRGHRYIGGLVKRSPYRMQVPNSGRWHVTVDMNGLRGTARSTARVLPGALPDARSLPLASAPGLVPSTTKDTPVSEISYASPVHFLSDCLFGRGDSA